jgi:hypothetical protein
MVRSGKGYGSTLARIDSMLQVVWYELGSKKFGMNVPNIHVLNSNSVSIEVGSMSPNIS